MTRLATHIFDHAHPKFFDQLLVHMNLYKHEKNRLFHGFVLEIWLIKKPCNLVGWEHFGPYLMKKNSHKHGICTGTQQISFHYRTNSVKINDQIFQQIQKTLFLAYFWSIFPILGAKFFPQKICLYMGFYHNAKT